MNSLRARVLLLVAGAGLLTALVLATVMHMSVRSYYTDVLYTQSLAFVDRVIEMNPDLWEEYERDPEDFSHRLANYTVFAPTTGLYLLDAQGRVLATSGERQDHWGRSRVDLGPVRASLVRDASMPIHADDPDRPGKTCIVAARPLARDGREVGWLYVVARAADVGAQTPALLKSYAIQTAVKVALLTLAIGVALTVAMIAVLTRPLTALTRVAERVRSGGFSAPLCETEFPFRDRNDEVGRLSRTFRDTLERLKIEMDRVTQTDVQRREMIANVSHDLRTPLTALIGQLETIRMKADQLEPAARDRFVQAAVDNAHHLRRLTDALNELAKLDSPELRIEREPIALGELADDLAHRYGIRADQAGVGLKVVYPDGLPLARVDAALIERAIGNLLDNAIRVTPTGGTIELRVLSEGDQVRVEVADSGPGVAAEDEARVFQRFYQGSKHREQRGSSGLGLAIVKRVVELHGGRVGLESRPARGATFWMALPTH
ncbi:MAG TPA: HAMP domain-containing sensor histidine kinase [Burkholderiaceae bacterium]|nr:HAMP domain-containing sensor histidine kinase [Burkholderiaceae bacterium]